MDLIMDEMREWNKNLETKTIPTDPNGLFLEPLQFDLDISALKQWKLAQYFSDELSHPCFGLRYMNLSHP